MIWQRENYVVNHIKCAPFLDSKIQTRILRFFTKHGLIQDHSNHGASTGAEKSIVNLVGYIMFY